MPDAIETAREWGRVLYNEKAAANAPENRLSLTVSEVLEGLGLLSSPEFLFRRDDAGRWGVAPECRQLVLGLVSYLGPKIATVQDLVHGLPPSETPAGAEEVLNRLRCAALALSSAASGGLGDMVPPDEAVHLAGDMIRELKRMTEEGAPEAS